MRRAHKALVMGLVVLPACLDLGGSWDATSATSATTTTATATATTTTTGTGTTTTGTGTTGTTESTGCGFLGCKDMPKHAVECDLWSQDCPEGQKCAPYANDGGGVWNAAKCFPVDPMPDLPGEPCMAEDPGLSTGDSCALGAACWEVDPDTGEGECIAMCQGTPSEPICPPGSFCWIYSSGVHNLCEVWCDPLIQDCPENNLCNPSAEKWSCVVDASGPEGQFGDPCEGFNTCDPGLYCAPPEYVPDCMAGGCCSPFCDTSEGNTCPGEGQVCIPWYEEGMAPPGYETVGVCGVPQP